MLGRIGVCPLPGTFMMILFKTRCGARLLLGQNCGEYVAQDGYHSVTPWSWVRLHTGSCKQLSVACPMPQSQGAADTTDLIDLYERCMYTISRTI